MKAHFKRPFSVYVKKARKPLQLAVQDAVDAVCANPDIGEAKVGDLAGIWVYKFKFQRQEYLVAYRPPTVEQRRQGVDIEFLVIDFYQVGSHENFYDELKRYLRAEGRPCATTAQELFEDLQALPATERGKFFLLLESRVFQEEDFTYEDVFGHLAEETFTVAEAAEYLDMSVPNFRRYVRRGQITPAQTVGRNQLFGTRDLRALKHALNTRRAP